MVIQEKNFWLETVAARLHESGERLPDSVDVAVIGAGFCGLSAARMLAKRGVPPWYSKPRTVGWEEQVPERCNGTDRPETPGADPDQPLWIRRGPADVSCVPGVD